MPRWPTLRYPTLAPLRPVVHGVDDRRRWPWSSRCAGGVPAKGHVDEVEDVEEVEGVGKL